MLNNTGSTIDQYKNIHEGLDQSFQKFQGLIINQKEIYYEYTDIFYNFAQKLNSLSKKITTNVI